MLAGEPRRRIGGERVERDRELERQEPDPGHDHHERDGRHDDEHVPNGRLSPPEQRQRLEHDEDRPGKRVRVVGRDEDRSAARRGRPGPDRRATGAGEASSRSRQAHGSGLAIPLAVRRRDGRAAPQRSRSRRHSSRRRAPALGPDARLWEPWVNEKIERPALFGRYGEMALFQLVGRMSRSGGITKKMAAKTAIPPAVLRNIAPSASAKIPSSIRYTAAADDGTSNAVVRERDLEDVVAREDRLGGEERDQHRRERQQERDRREDPELRPQHRQPFRNGGQAGTDHPGRVLAGDHEHAEHTDRKLREVDAGKRDVERMPVGPVVRRSCGPSAPR